jgi:DNA-binding HxlR family transcriptional regulator
LANRWSLLILRECFPRKRRFEAFEASLGITRHVLADRLKKLVRFGVLRRIPYQESPKRYEYIKESPKRYEYILTQKSLDLYPIIISIVDWGNSHMVDSRGRPMLHSTRTAAICLIPCGLFGMRRMTGAADPALHTTACKGGIVPVLSLLVSSAAKARPTRGRPGRATSPPLATPRPRRWSTDRRRPERGLRLDRRGQRAPRRPMR